MQSADKNVLKDTTVNYPLCWWPSWNSDLSTLPSAACKLPPNNHIYEKTMFLHSLLSNFSLFSELNFEKMVHHFSFVCCHMMCRYVLSSVLLCCYVRYDFYIKTMFLSSSTPVVCRSDHVLFMLFVLFVFCVCCDVKHMLCCAILVWCTLCCQFLWTVKF